MNQDKPIAIEVKGLAKSYKISHELRPEYATVKDSLSNLLKKPFRKSKKSKEIFWALKDVSFEVKPGEIFGVIGRNGSGKSTLLKILSRIVEPTKGEVTMHGRVASLLEVGTGFHPELTGRENVYFNGSMLGMSRAEIAKKFDDIVAFSEIEQFLDTPVKFYSSGMYVRLAFAVAAHLEPDILILDEVLAVGDAAFQKKCMNKILSIASEGKTILFVSHSMGSVNELCDRAILLRKGKITMIGDTEAVTDKYMEADLTPAEREVLLAAKREAERASKEAENAASPPSGVVQFKGSIQVQAAKHVFSDFRLNGKSIQQKIIIPSGQPITIETDYVNEGMPRDLLIGFAIKNLTTGGFPVYVHNKLENANYETGKQGGIKAVVDVPKLAPGYYALEVNAWLDDKMFVENEPIGKFRILEVPSFRSKQTFTSFPSSVLIDSTWSFK